MFESQFVDNHKFILATDEVGRGPLAGPVVTCAVKVSIDNLKSLVERLDSVGVTDSKKLTLKKMESILKELGVEKFSKFNEHELFQYSVEKVAPKKIDELNIFQASLFGMKKSCHNLLCDSSSVVLVDGKFPFSSKKINDIHPIIKGDSKSSLIGLASIIAKVCRDHLMTREAKKYPHYGFEKNAGYPTAVHRKAIEDYGITPIHRKSFKGVKEFVTQENS
ncbi:ribonuclease HII [Halobacteriovorax sp. DA5]|uniref:ribonuclease HII n=1 Tax=Halobacteriovorax sp. DA5 TaxID=2067553 RepID=UPI000CD0D6A2|nr:ribonuclease HII [Halobacteriovorax sp. DA5]POB14161.1 ribonuclease HII [Halobacteriovorax sp. DA5]